MRQPGEPSVEEILASIQKVMARDHRGEPGPSTRAGEAEPPSGTDAGALAPELLLDDDGSPVPVLELTDAHMEAAPAQASAPVEPGSSANLASAASAASTPEAPLLAETARASLRDLLSSLAVLADRAAPSPGLRPGETSLEGLVRDMLRPMLAEWLDKNLPPIVERLVAAELARAVDPRG